MTLRVEGVSVSFPKLVSRCTSHPNLFNEFLLSYQSHGVMINWMKW